MQKSLIFTLLFLALIPATFAGIEIKTSPISNQVKPGEIVSYNLLINNTDMWNKTATIFLLTDKLYAIEPTYYLVLPAYTETIATVKIIVPTSTAAQRYYEDIFIKFSDFSEATQRISYDVKGPELYLKLNSVEAEQNINPLEEFMLTINIENNYFEKAKTALLHINIYDEADSSIYYTSKQIDLLEGINDYEIPVNIGEELSNEYLKVNVSMQWFELNLGGVSALTTMEQFTGLVEAAEESGAKIITNNGETGSEAFLQEEPITFLESLLIKSATVPYTLTSSSIIYEVPALNPGESVALSYEIDYVVPVLIIFFLAAIIYFSATRTVHINKEIKDIRVSHNFLSFRIVLDVQNVSGKKFNHLRVKEFLPSIISEVYGFGTVEGEIKPLGKQKYIQWEVKNLKPKETVEFSYIAKTKIGFLGDLTLENSGVEILNEQGKVEKKIKTQTLILSINQRKHKSKEL